MFVTQAISYELVFMGLHLLNVNIMSIPLESTLLIFIQIKKYFVYKRLFNV